MTTGRCTQQCPDSEIYFRIKNNLLHPLECKDPFSVHSNTKNYKQEPDFERICKSYSRSAAAKQIDEEDVRTVDALLDTIRYLECMEREFDEDKHWDLVYEYMDDRIRAIRQDIIVQNKHTQPESEAIYDAVIRFYLRAMYRCESLKTRCYVSLFHARELNEVMLRWFNGKHANEEVLMMFICYSLDRNDICKIIWGRKKHLSEASITLAFNLVSAYTNRNFVKFFQLVTGLDVYLKYALVPHIRALRILSLRTLASASSCSIAKWPIEVLTKWLGYPEEAHLIYCLGEMFEGGITDRNIVKFHGHKLKAETKYASFYWISL